MRMATGSGKNAQMFRVSVRTTEPSPCPYCALFSYAIAGCFSIESIRFLSGRSSFLSHSVCYGIVDEAGLDVERKRGFKCFCCDPQKPAPGCLAYDVARAVLKVRSQPKWSELRKRLGVTNRPHVSTTTEKGVVKNGENGTEKSTQQFSHFGTHAKSSVQTRAKRNQSTEAATNP